MSKALPRVPVTFNWAGVKTSVNDRYLQPGELTILVNWRRTDEGRLRKRLGNDRTTISTFTGATYAGPVIDVVPASALVVRDTNNQIFAKAPDGIGYYKGTDLRAHPTLQHVENLATVTTANKPAVARRANGDLFEFAIGMGGAGVNTGFSVTVLASDGTVKHRSALKSAVDMTAYSVATDASDRVWLAYITDDDPDAIYTYRFDATGAIDVSNTITVASHEFTDVKLRLLVNGELALAALSLTTSGADYIVTQYHAYLNTTTGAAAGSPAAVSTPYTSAPHAANFACANGLSIAESAGDATSWYYAFWRTKVDGELQLVRSKINLSTLAVTTTVELDTAAPSPATDVYVGQSTGYVTANNAEVWYGSILHVDPTDGPDGVRDAVVTRFTYNGTAVTEGVVARSAYVAGDVFTVASKRYLLTGFDDLASLTALGAQRGYFVRDATTGQIVTEILNGLGGQVFFAGGANNLGGFTPGVRSGHTVPVVVSGNTAWIPLLQAGSTAVAHEPVLAAVDFAPTYCSWAPNVVPGGPPKTVSAADALTELAPLHYPYAELSIVSNGTAGTTHSRNRAAFRYCTTNADGEVTPSAPSETQELTFENYVSPDTVYGVQIPTLRHAIGPTWIELFLSENLEVAGADTTLYLARRIANKPTQDSVSVDIEPSLFQAGSGAILETTNLEVRLENGSVPPARLAELWRDRLWLAGTPEDDLLYSQEKRAGHGYEFNEALSVVWQDGTGPITAIRALSFDALVVFRRDAVGLVTGPGPLPAGPNNFVVQTISYQKGTTNPKSVVLGPLGVYFLNASDNRPHVVTAGGTTEISQGFEAYLAQVPIAALHDVALGVVRWYMSSGKQLKLDYRFPLPDQPAGQWLEDSGAGLPAAIGAVSIAGVAVMVEAGTASVARTWQAGTGFTDNGAEVLKDLVTGRMGPAGFLGEFDVDEVGISSTPLSGASTYTYTLTPDTGSAEAHPDAGGVTPDVWFRSALSRIRDVRLRIQETAAMPGEGRSFDGVTLLFRPRGQRKPYRAIG